MKIKNIVSLFFITIVIFFLVVYISEGTGYYDHITNNKYILTKEKVKEFEKDIQNGNNIDAKKYLEKDKDYKNLYNKTGMTISNIIEKVFNKGMNKFIKEVNKASR